MAENRKRDELREQPSDKLQLNFLYGIKDISLLMYKRKIAVILIIAGFVLMSILYSIFVQPIYRATASVVPPLDTRVSGINVAGCPSWDGGDVFKVFRTHILDQSRKDDFFKHPEVAKLIQTNKSNIKIGVDFDRNDKLTLNVDGTSRELVERLASNYIGTNERTAAKQVIASVMSCMEQKELTLSEEIAVERVAARERLENKIQILEEARNIAAQIGQYEFDVRAPENPLFARGVKALDAEIDAIRNRSINDTAIDLMSDQIMRDKITLRTIELKKNTTSWSRIITAQVQSEPYADLEPIFPKRSIIWLYGLIAGLLVSVFFVISTNKLKLSQAKRSNRS